MLCRMQQKLLKLILNIQRYFCTISLQFCISVHILNICAYRVIIGEAPLILPWENLRKP